MDCRIAINDNLTAELINSKRKSRKKLTKNKTVILCLDPLATKIFFYLLESSHNYKECVAKYWSTENISRLFIAPSSERQEFLDHIGCHMTSALLWKVIEQDDALHWLSTLGGAFSNLGEKDQQFALRAGLNAFKQMLVGNSCGDLTVVAKCQLFIGHSELQLGQLRSAASRVRSVWRLCHSPPLSKIAATDKLVTMCRGVWSRIKYERMLRTEKMVEEEVEQKFCVPSGYREILESNGAIFQSKKSLVDEYFDTADLALLRQDCWLRKRGDKYELKVAPEGQHHTQSSVGMTQYREISGKSDVESELVKITNTALDEMTRLCVVDAVREAWKLGDFNIVIDRLEDDGWSVGEIELIATRGENIEELKERIENLGQQLKFTVQSYGKVRHCLENQNPDAWKLLTTLSP